MLIDMLTIVWALVAQPPVYCSALGFALGTAGVLIREVLR